MDTDLLILALVQSKNEAADDVLLEALQRGSEQEKPILLAALLKRATVRGLRGVIALFDGLSESLQQVVLTNIRQLHHALQECGRSDDPVVRRGAMKLIALGRQGKLAYVLSENLRNEHDEVSKAAIDALVILARWVWTQTRWLQKGDYDLRPQLQIQEQPGAPAEETAAATDSKNAGGGPTAIYQELLSQRPEIEAAVARAIDLSRGRYGPELLRAALLLCDWPGSKTLAILQTAKHGGQTLMVRRLQQPPSVEHVEAFLLSGSHGQLRSHFGTVFTHMSEIAVLDVLLQKTHWLKDVQLQICTHQVTRGIWWGESDLLEDIDQRDPEQAAKIGDWLAASGVHDVVQDNRMEHLKARAQGSFAGRLRLLRLAGQRRRGASVQFIKTFLSDPDERLARMAVREMIRREPPEYENTLLTMMPTASPSVRRVISRSLGHVGFEQLWDRFDRLDANTRQQAGRAMLKILPDSPARLTRRLTAGPVEQRLKALQMTQELDLVKPLHGVVAGLTENSNPKVRSKAVSVLAEAPDLPDDELMRRMLTDPDPRVRANAIEVVDTASGAQFVPLLKEKARGGHNRERANSIAALHKMRVGNASESLLEMLHDQRPDHRVSAMWAIRHLGFWKLLGEIGHLAKQDNNLRVRRYALAVLKGVAEMVQRQQKEKAG